jgi:hypothetical protein
LALEGGFCAWRWHPGASLSAQSGTLWARHGPRATSWVRCICSARGSRGGGGRPDLQRRSGAHQRRRSARWRGGCLSGVHVRQARGPQSRRSREILSRSAEPTGAVKPSPSGPSVCARHVVEIGGVSPVLGRSRGPRECSRLPGRAPRRRGRPGHQPRGAARNPRQPPDSADADPTRGPARRWHRHTSHLNAGLDRPPPQRSNHRAARRSPPGHQPRGRPRDRHRGPSTAKSAAEHAAADAPTWCANSPPCRVHCAPLNSSTAGTRTARRIRAASRASTTATTFTGVWTVDPCAPLPVHASRFVGGYPVAQLRPCSEGRRAEAGARSHSPCAVATAACRRIPYGCISPPRWPCGSAQSHHTSQRVGRSSSGRGIPTVP